MMIYPFLQIQNNITEIRVDAFKLLVMFKRPIPRTATTIGAWLNIFQVNFHKQNYYSSHSHLFLYLFSLFNIALQFLIVMSICTNCTLLVCLYDQEGKWKLEPGLAAILIMEHVLLLIKFGFSHFVPEVVILFLQFSLWFVLLFLHNKSYILYRSLLGLKQTEFRM